MSRVSRLSTVALVAVMVAGCTPGPSAATPALTQPAVPASPSRPSPTITPTPAFMAGPKALENCTHAQVMQDGNIQPVLCPDGGPSLAADALMRRMNFGDAVMNLQAGASLAGVEAAMCSDKRISHMTNPMEFSVYEIRSLEVGWRYGYQPEDWLLSARC